VIFFVVPVRFRPVADVDCWNAPPVKEKFPAQFKVYAVAAVPNVTTDPDTEISPLHVNVDPTFVVHVNDVASASSSVKDEHVSKPLPCLKIYVFEAETESNIAPHVIGTLFTELSVIAPALLDPNDNDAVPKDIVDSSAFLANVNVLVSLYDVENETVVTFA